MERDWIFLFFYFHSSILRSISLNTRKDTRLSVPPETEKNEFSPSTWHEQFFFTSRLGWKWKEILSKPKSEMKIENYVGCLSQILKRFRHAANDGKVNYPTSLLMFDDFNVKQRLRKSK